MIFNEDIFVGGVSIVLGMLALLAAIFNWEAAFRLVKVRWLEDRYGRARVRWFYALLGIALISLGCAIALGFGPNKRRRREQKEALVRMVEPPIHRVV